MFKGYGKKLTKEEKKAFKAVFVGIIKQNDLHAKLDELNLMGSQNT